MCFFPKFHHPVSRSPNVSIGSNCPCFPITAILAIGTLRVPLPLPIHPRSSQAGPGYARFSRSWAEFGVGLSQDSRSQSPGPAFAVSTAHTFPFPMKLCSFCVLRWPEPSLTLARSSWRINCESVHRAFSGAVGIRRCFHVQPDHISLPKPPMQLAQSHTAANRCIDQKSNSAGGAERWVSKQ